MRRRFVRRVVSYPVSAALLAVSLCLAIPSPAAALSMEDYFNISYDPVSFSDTEIDGDEVFYATVRGRATCTADLPLPVREARITGRVIAEHTVSGTRVTLNPSYTITIDPFPRTKDDFNGNREDYTSAISGPR